MANSLVRSREDRMIAGVMGGIANHFGWNVTILRVLFVLVSCMSAAFPGILVYLILWMIMPLAKRQNSNDHEYPVRDIN